MTTSELTLQSGTSRPGAPVKPLRSGHLPDATVTTLELLQQLKGGTVLVELPGSEVHTVGHGDQRAMLRVHDLRTFERTLGEGDIGFAECFIDGHWETDQLTALLTLLATNRETLARAVHGRWWPVLRHKLVHWMRMNTRAGSRRNILAHYDLGNDFYSLWLDPTMTYSAGIFPATAVDEVDGGQALHAAQQAKYRRILEQINPRARQTILEVGCGWGGFAEMAVRDYGVHIHGITLSPAQLAFAQKRAHDGGWSEQAHFELRDYRDLKGQFDHIVSIEMFEAVGERFWPSYFKQLRACLKPGGRAVVQSITIANERFAAYRRGTDFIQRHIFPGGMLPSPEVFNRRVASADLRITDSYAFGLGYARTLAQWHHAFSAAWPAIAGPNFDERFRRLWSFYLAYCEAGFRSGATDVYQFTLEAK